AGLGTAFTIPLEFCGYKREQQFLPIFVNAYVPPQPTPERCFAFGQALAHAIEREGRRAVVLASGGLSHYPGTPQYPHPDIDTDRVIFERLAPPLSRIATVTPRASISTSRSGPRWSRSTATHCATAFGSTRCCSTSWRRGWRQNRRRARPIHSVAVAHVVIRRVIRARTS